MLVAFSGGVDSSFLLAVAKEVLQKDVVALMTVSSSTPPEDYTQATTLAQTLNVELLTIPHDELAIPQYAANPINRCYFCKDSLYEICRREAGRLSLRTIADGVNLDDLQDYRPGIQAAKEYKIVHPLVEAGFTKAESSTGESITRITNMGETSIAVPFFSRSLWNSHYCNDAVANCPGRSSDSFARIS